MEKFLRTLLFSRLFPAPLWLQPFDCTGMQGGCGSSEGRIFSKAAHKRESRLPLQSMRLLMFPLGPNLQFICFSMLHSHCNTPPARRSTEREAVEKKFFLGGPFFIFGCSLIPVNSPCLEPAHPRAGAIHCPTSSTSSISADT